MVQRDINIGMNMHAMIQVLCVVWVHGEVIYVDRGLSHCLSVLWPEERARCRRKLTDMEYI
jgi:hypothetical protein